MIAVDTNILVYAHRRDSEYHDQAAQALRQLIESGRAWLMPWPCVREFINIVTHPRIYRPPSSLDEAFGQIEIWFDCPNNRCLGEDDSYWDTFKQVTRQGKMVGPMIHDAHVAALCIMSGVTELWSADRDFNRVKGLKIINPLV
jgi:toxin-antitoxin system PIN domain toxin